MADPYSINTVPLQTLATQLSTAEGLQSGPEWRDRDIEIPGSHGVLDMGLDPTGQRRAYGPGKIVYSGWVKGVDPTTGAWAGDGLGPYLTRVDELMRMFYARALVMDHTRPDGTRRATGKLVGAIEPAREPSSPWFGRWEARVQIPGTFWSEITPVTASATVVSGGTLSLATFAPSNAPIADGLITFGPGNNPTLTQGGTFVAYDGVITTGRQLTIDCSDWSLGHGSGTAWTPNPAALRYGPGPSWFELDPTAALSASLIHTGGGSMFVSFAARRRFLTS